MLATLRPSLLKPHGTRSRSPLRVSGLRELVLRGARTHKLELKHPPKAMWSRHSKADTEVTKIMLHRQPTLAHPTVHLRPAAPHDWEELFAAASDPEIWADHPAHDRWREPTFRAFFEEGLASAGMLVAIEPDSGAIIGSSRYDLKRVEAGEVEIGWTFLVRRHWGGRTNHAMKALMVGYALKQVERVVFVIGETNIRSRTAIGRIGAVLCDRRLTVQLSTGPFPHLCFAIDRTSFEIGPLAPLWTQRLR